MTHRSIFLPNESFSDVQDKLSRCKTDDELKHAMSERLKANGWTRDKEDSFRKCAATCGFVLPGQRPKTNPLAKDSAGRTNARLLADAIKHDLRTSKIEPEMEE